jgi:hypothetical protein
MDTAAEITNDRGNATLAGVAKNFNLSFLPKNLTTQCQSLIVSYHELHGYTCLPNTLWKAGLGHFIEEHQEFRQLLRKASTTRSAKKSNDGFAQIATTLLSLEILASSFAGWSAIDCSRNPSTKRAWPAHAVDGILPVPAKIHQLSRHSEVGSASRR